MTPIIYAVIAELDGMEFLCMDYYDADGKLADQIAMPVTARLNVAFKIIDLLSQHSCDIADLETDNERIFKSVLPHLGINVRLVLSSELSFVYRVVSEASPHYKILKELYFPKTEEEVSISNEKQEHLTWWRRLIKSIRGWVANVKVGIERKIRCSR